MYVFSKYTYYFYPIAINHNLIKIKLIKILIGDYINGKTNKNW